MLPSPSLYLRKRIWQGTGVTNFPTYFRIEVRTPCNTADMYTIWSRGQNCQRDDDRTISLPTAFRSCWERILAPLSARVEALTFASVPTILITFSIACFSQLRAFYNFLQQRNKRKRNANVGYTFLFFSWRNKERQRVKSFSIIAHRACSPDKSKLSSAR